MQTDYDVVAEGSATPPARRRGRPKGSRNKPALRREVPPGQKPLDDYRHVDPDALISRQLTLIDWAQQALRNEMQRAMQGEGKWIQPGDIGKLSELSNALVRSLDALKKHNDLAEELQKRLTGQQLLEAALKKVEGQDLPTIRYAIKRLRAYVEKLAPVTSQDKQQMGEPPNGRAADAIARLDD
jgi:hypothetical protein